MAKSQTKQPARDPARDALAAAIDAVASARAEALSNRAAIDRARAILDEAQIEVYEARDALAAAKAGEAGRIARAASTGEALTADRGLRDARVRLADADDRLDASKEAFGAIEAGASEAEAALHRAKNHLENSIDDVIRSVEVARLLSETQEVQADLIRRRNELKYLVQGQLIDPTIEADVRRFLYTAGEIPVVEPVSFRMWSRSLNPPPAAWQVSRDALAIDADAALPC